MNKKLVFILILATVIRLISINQSLWLDEATTAQVARMGVVSYLTKLAPSDFHPPLFYFAVIVLSKLIGYSELALRSTSIISGVLSVYVVYKIGKLIANDRVGLVGAAILALSGLHIYYSQEARMYSLATLFVALSMYFFINYVKTESTKEFPFFAIFVVISTLTHYLTIFMLPVYVFVMFIRKDFNRKVILTLVLIGSIWLLWTPTFIEQLTNGLNVEGSVPLWWNLLGKTTPKEIALLPAKFIYGRISIENNQVYVILTGIGVAIYGYLSLLAIPFQKGKFRFDLQSQSIPIWLWLVIPVTLSAILGLGIPVFGYFRLLFVLPALYLILALGLSTLKGNAFKFLLTLVLILNLTSSLVYLCNPRFHRENWKDLVSFVESSNMEYQVIFPSTSQYEAYRYYASESNPQPSREIDGKYDKVFYVRYLEDVFDPNRDSLNRLKEFGYNKEAEYSYGGLELWLYENSN